ncbi:MAG: hypothetical protein ACYC1G_08315 [Thiobacillus sp.]|mgnify:FL=1
MSRESRFYVSDMIEFPEKVALLRNLHALKAAANAGQITDPAE